MGIEYATDWMTAFVGVPADPAPVPRRRRTSRLDAPAAPTTAAEYTGGGGGTTGEKDRAPPTGGHD